mmetsp:Transcript_8391/g.13682  ORF Transcript_8391/g.13682 Transcript_8391/m.13682 type:complete len:278 (+) Transcript_8391:5662-6495(+)
MTTEAAQVLRRAWSISMATVLEPLLLRMRWLTPLLCLPYPLFLRLRLRLSLRLGLPQGRATLQPLFVKRPPPLLACLCLSRWPPPPPTVCAHQPQPLPLPLQKAPMQLYRHPCLQKCHHSPPRNTRQLHPPPPPLPLPRLPSPILDSHRRRYHHSPLPARCCPLKLLLLLPPPPPTPRSTLLPRWSTFNTLLPRRLQSLRCPPNPLMLTKDPQQMGTERPWPPPSRQKQRSRVPRARSQELVKAKAGPPLPTSQQCECARLVRGGHMRASLGRCTLR